MPDADDGSVISRRVVASVTAYLLTHSVLPLLPGKTEFRPDRLAW